MTRHLNIILLFLLVGLFSCKDEFWPELGEYENILVVDGSISNEPGPYEIRLSFSTSVQNPEFNPYTGASISIIDDEGVVEELTEYSPGHYQTQQNGIQGVIGKSYKTIIQTQNKVYESDFQKIPEPVGIESVYAKIETVQTENELYSLYGYQFYLNTQLAKSDSNFFMWRVYGTYKYHSDFLIKYIWNGSLKPFPKPDSLYTCYNDDNIDNFYTMSTMGLSDPVIAGLPLNFVNTETRKLSIRYSLLVKQYSLPKSGFEYFDQVSSISDDQEALYTEQPYQVRGNIFNRLDPDELVLGYFMVGGVTEKRIYVDRPSNVDFRYGVCVLTRRDYEAFGYIGWTDRVSWPLYVTTNPDGARALPVQGCMDCREDGGVPIVPDFWED